MKAAILEEIYSPLTVSSVELTPLAFGQVLVQVLVSGLCGSQLQEINGNKGNQKFLPHLMGHEGAGIVIEIGPGVTNLKNGDKVVMHWRQGAGIESIFPSYIYRDRVISSGKITTFNEYSIVSENRLTRVPSNTPSDLAALMGCSITTAFGIFDNEVDIKIGESVLIIGCGGVGLSLIQAAKLKGAGHIVVVDPNENKCALAENIGCNVFATQISNLDGMFDIVVDTTGKKDVIGAAFGVMSKFGRMILVGQPLPGDSLLIPNSLNFFNGSGLSIKATQGGKTNPSQDIKRYLKLFESKQASFDKLITHRFKLEEINDAIEVLKSGNAGRIMIDITVE
jgi:S-(hydroxymethyl)glutathione dehydrogenase/alcohol dehydrogenase